ncbi:hypothetical protein [Geothrix sp. 21YS21S-2]|uniref:DUF6982 domain-containing protein n=1 Tax=Geothrix sp. 21YS21S-2 TaxID=3068893 RepID=UPI0027B9A1EC|nr:hypothetical protein [Geothrix sp. 21YS21S-2]
MNKVVAHFQDGTVAKGLTVDFVATKDRFHLVTEGAPPREILLSDLKGLFFVKDLDGDLGHAKSNIFHPGDVSPGRRIRVDFRDGETLLGTTQAYTPGRFGFFVVPADKKSNTERAYVISSATSSVTFL